MVEDVPGVESVDGLYRAEPAHLGRCLPRLASSRSLGLGKAKGEGPGWPPHATNLHRRETTAVPGRRPIHHHPHPAATVDLRARHRAIRPSDALARPAAQQRIRPPGTGAHADRASRSHPRSARIRRSVGRRVPYISRRRTVQPVIYCRLPCTGSGSPQAGRAGPGHAPEQRLGRPRGSLPNPGLLQRSLQPAGRSTYFALPARYHNPACCGSRSHRTRDASSGRGFQSR